MVESERPGNSQSEPITTQKVPTTTSDGVSMAGSTGIGVFAHIIVPCAR